MTIFVLSKIPIHCYLLEMGWFQKRSSDSSGLVLLMPDGTAPQIHSQEDLNILFEGWTVTPENSAAWVLEKVDQQAWIKASTTLFSLGLQKDEGGPSIYATGEIYISGLEGQNSEMQGESILTSEFTVISWAYGFSKNHLVLFHNDILGFEGVGSAAAEFAFQGAALFKNRKLQNLGHTQIYLACRFGKDGQANRRSVIFWNSLAALLKRRFR